MVRSRQTIVSENKVLDTVLEVSAMDQERFVETVRESLHIKNHFQLLLWLQGDFQRCVPHQIFIVAWGDFVTGQFRHDVVSAVPGVRTGQIKGKDINQFVGHLFSRWVDQGCTAFAARFEGLNLGVNSAGRQELEAFETMHSVLVHGIRDERGRHDCLYIFLNTDSDIAPSSLDNLRITLPFIDVAIRQVAHLPSQYPAHQAPEAEAEELPGEQLLTDRELEIMLWVKAGKTNYEIGIILNISTFTVKNHLQRIFRKLDVTNRAQAASTSLSSAKDSEVEPAVLTRTRQASKQAG